MILRRVLVVCLALVLASSIGPANALEEIDLLDAQLLGLPEIEITITDDGWDAPSSVPAGRYLVTARYDGDQDFATVAFLRLTPDFTLDDLNDILAYLAMQDETTGSDGTDVDDAAWHDGGLGWTQGLTLAGGVSPLRNSFAQGIVDLHPGQWAIWSDSWEREATLLEVTGAWPASTPEPPADVTFTSVLDGDRLALRMDGEVTTATRIIAVVNASDQAHYLEVMALSDPAEAAEVAIAVRDLTAEEPLGTSLPASFSIDISEFYAATQSPGTVQWMIVRFAPGDYVIGSWLPDRERAGITQAEAGLIAAFSVTDA